MTKDEFNEIIQIHERLDALYKVEKVITNNTSLTFVRQKDGYVDYSTLQHISDILEKHHKMIYNEVLEQIRELNDKISNITIL